jgi:hypothetical protein
MARLTGACVAVAAVAGMMILPARGDSAKPAPGTRFTVHDHRIKGAGWHARINISRKDAGVVRYVELYDERCEETIAVDRIRLAPDGSLDASAEFAATNRRGVEHSGRWRLHAEFPRHRWAEASFSITEPGCRAIHTFAAVGSGSGRTGHTHGHSDPFAYPDIAHAPRSDRAQARRMLRRVRAAAANRFPTFARARAEGFNRYMSSRTVPEPGVFHLWSRRYNTDATTLDPARPESLVFWKPTRRGASPVLLAFMFRRHPGPRPPFARTITSWHTHGPGGDQMTHVWLARSLRGAYANCLPVPELEQSVQAFDFENVSAGGPESRPCVQRTL